MATQYSNDEDLLQYMPDVRTHGHKDFDDDHLEAKKDIDRIIEVRWYRPRLHRRINQDIELLDGDVSFDPEKMLNAVAQLKKASCFLVLGEYILPKLSNFTVTEGNGDEFQNRADYFADRFNREIDQVLNVGIDYDWDNSGMIDQDEDALPSRSVFVGRG